MTRTLEASFGTPRDALDVDFDYFGTMIRVNPGLTRKPLIAFAKAAEGFDEKHPDLEMMENATDDLVRAVLHPADVEAFMAVAAVHRQEIEDLLAVATQLIEAVTEVPTERPSSSSDGPNSTGSSSGVVSRSPVVTRLEKAGRPDLALIVVQAQESRSA